MTTILASQAVSPNVQGYCCHSRYSSMGMPGNRNVNKYVGQEFNQVDKTGQVVKYLMYVEVNICNNDIPFKSFYIEINNLHFCFKWLLTEVHSKHKTFKTFCINPIPMLRRYYCWYYYSWNVLKCSYLWPGFKCSYLWSVLKCFYTPTSTST